jgi:hypothetical protein
MLSFHKKYQADKFSQNGEDGIIEEILRRLQINSGVCVEFGAHNGVFCSNTRKLVLTGNWKALFIEGDDGLYEALVKTYKSASNLDFDKPGHKILDTTLLHAWIYPTNVNQILPKQVDVLSIDVDGIDYHIWDAWQGRAKIVVIEINSSLDPNSELCGDPERGSSFRSMVELGSKKGYFPVCHCGNIIFVHEDYRELFPEIPIFVMPADFFNTSWLNQ